MTFSLDWHTLQKIEKNGTFIELLACCGYIVNREDRKCQECGREVTVTLRGIRNQVSQTYQWHIFITDVEGELIALLSCPYCLHIINTANRSCKCDGHVSLELKQNRQKSGRWELHREVTGDSLPIADGIIIVTEDAEPNRPIHAPPLELPPNFDPIIGGLYCPNHYFSYVGMPHVDKDGNCTGHHVKLSAVLVFTDEGIFVQRRAYDLSTDAPRHAALFDAEQIDIVQLHCPYCEHPITDKSLLCTAVCKSAYIIDVVQKPPTERPRPVGVGTDTHILIEIAPRWAWDTTRPHNALVMEGINTADAETLSHPAPPDPDIDPDDPKDYDTIYAEYIHLKTMGYSIRTAAKEIGISRGKLENVIRKKRAELEKLKKREARRQLYK